MLPQLSGSVCLGCPVHPDNHLCYEDVWDSLGKYGVLEKREGGGIIGEKAGYQPWFEEFLEIEEGVLEQGIKSLSSPSGEEAAPFLWIQGCPWQAEELNDVY